MRFRQAPVRKFGREERRIIWKLVGEQATAFLLARNITAKLGAMVFVKA